MKMIPSKVRDRKVTMMKGGIAIITLVLAVVELPSYNPFYYAADT